MPHSWRNRLAVQMMYVGCVVAVLWLQILPSGVEARYSNPDLILALTLSWALYRPDALTPLLVGIVVLFADLILQKAPGLWALGSVLGTIFLRSRKLEYDHRTFLDTWLLLTIVTISIFLFYNLILRITFTSAPSFMLGLAEIISTCLMFPFIHIASIQVFRVAPHAKAKVNFR